MTALLLAACASEPAQPTSTETAAADVPKKVCDEEPVTGSRIKRCDGDRSGVEVMSREQLERMTSRSGLLPENGLPPRR